jgi:cell division protein FtsW
MLKNKKNINSYLIIVSVSVFLLVGIIILSSVSAISSQEKTGTPYYFLTRQVIYIFIGVLSGYIFYKIDLSFLKKWSSFIVIGNIFLLIATFIPIIGFSSGGAKRWISLGPLTLQPAEILKLSFVIFLSAWISRITHNKKKGKIDNGIFILITVFLVSVFILFKQPDISNLAILFAISFIIYFASNTPLWHSGLLVLIGSVSMGIIIKISPHAFNRMLTFLNPGQDPMGSGYQIKQALIAIGSGGLLGTGIGMSKQKLGFLPETMGDAIFATFAEEVGFIGASILVMFFILFLISGFNIAKNSQDSFSYLIAAGIVSWIIVQTFVNMGAMIGLLPLTGITLPFISYGGSHLLTELSAVGLLLNVSKNNIIKKR